MISEQTAMNTPARTLVTGTWRADIGCRGAALRTYFRPLARALKTWARVPVLPYAALWEAAVVVDLVIDEKFL